MSEENRNKRFDQNVLPELTPFQIVGPETVRTEPRTSTEGKPYTIHLLTIKPKNSSKVFEVEAFKRTADRCRILQMMNPTGYLSATWKMSQTEDGYDELIIAGGAGAVV